MRQEKFKSMNDYLKWLKFEEEVEKIFDIQEISKGLTKAILPLFLEGKSQKEVAQMLGLHVMPTMNRYFFVFEKMDVKSLKMIITYFNYQ